MNFDSIVNLIDVIVWPVTVIAISVYFRESIEELFTRLESVTRGDTSITFKEQLNSLEISVEKADAKIESKTMMSLASNTEEFETLASYNPRLAVIDVWNTVERAAERVADKIKILPGGSPLVSKVVRILVEEGFLPVEVRDAYFRAREIRNYAVHELNFEATTDEVSKYIKTVGNIAEWLNVASVMVGDVKTD